MTTPARTDEHLVPKPRVEVHPQPMTPEVGNASPSLWGRLVSALHALEARLARRFGVGDLVASILMGVALSGVSAPVLLSSLHDSDAGVDVSAVGVWAVMAGATALLIAVSIDVAISKRMARRHSHH